MDTIEFTPGAAREFAQLPSDVLRRVAKKIDALAQEPRPNGSIKLKGEDLWRIRIGHYRVVYQILDATLVVTLVRVRHRRDAYR